MPNTDLNTSNKLKDIVNRNKIAKGDFIITSSKGNLYVSSSAAHLLIANEIVNPDSSDTISRHDKDLIDLYTHAEKPVTEAEQIFSRSLDNMLTSHEALTEKVKRICGSVKDYSVKLGNGLLQVQRTADFDKLEKQVSILERAAQALTTLSELNEKGKLESIIKSIK